MSTHYSFAHDAYAGDLQTAWAHLTDGEETGQIVKVAGRVMLLRTQGKLAFGTLRDSTGEIQLFALSAVTADFEHFTRLHLGDWVGVTGEVVKTKRGELSVKVADFVVLAEARHNFGDKWAGIADFDLRYRHREADLWANPEARTSLARRSATIASLRRHLADQRFMEVETPMLNAIPTGAAARPFVTHHNALDADFFLRIAPELWLKRLVVGGFERVFELGRVFRNEGISPRHNPEFTMLELYVAYYDFEDMMTLTEELVAAVALDVVGTTELSYQGRELSLAAPWRRVSMAELASEAVGEAVSVETPRERLAALLDQRGVAAHASWGQGRCLSELFEATAEADLWQPTFVTEHPLEISPLARQHRSKPGVTERFEAFVVGRELANGFSELIDPDDQRARFEDQARLAAAGDDEAMQIDLDYIKALEWGLPPTAGLGIGIDRLAMILADQGNIREVIAFPTLKPLKD